MRGRHHHHFNMKGPHHHKRGPHHHHMRGPHHCMEGPRHHKKDHHHHKGHRGFKGCQKFRFFELHNSRKGLEVDKDKQNSTEPGQGGVENVDAGMEALSINPENPRLERHIRKLNKKMEKGNVKETKKLLKLQKKYGPLLLSSEEHLQVRKKQEASKLEKKVNKIDKIIARLEKKKECHLTLLTLIKEQINVTTNEPSAPVQETQPVSQDIPMIQVAE